MFTVFWFIIALFLLTYSVAWLADNNGSVMVNWLGYELQTDVLTIIIVTIVLTITIILLASLLTRILAIKFPSLLKFFFKRNYTRSLEKIVNRHHQGFDELANLLLAIENHDEKYIKIHQKNFQNKIKHKKINDFILGKIALDQKDNVKIIKYFSQFIGNNNANILCLKARFNLALKQNDETRIIAWGKQLCKLENNSEIAKTLIPICKKHGLWQDVKELLKLLGDELEGHLDANEIDALNLFEMKYFYQKNKFLKSQKYAKILLKKDENSNLAMAYYLKSWIKLGFRFCVSKKIKKLWQKNPQLFLAEIYDLNFRKFSNKRRFNLMKKLLKNSKDQNLANFVLGKLAFKIGFYQQSIEILQALSLQHPSQRIYQIIAKSHQLLGNDSENQKNLTLAKNFTKS
jgi:HemY protein